MVFDRQFIISPNGFEQLDEWNSLNLFDGTVLAYSNKLHITANKGCSVVLLGHAWQTIPGLSSPEDIISNWDASTPLETVYEAEQSWCGRYVIFFYGIILTDCCGTLGVFYSGGMVSSSIAVMCLAQGLKVENPPIVFGRKPDFVPGPLTTYKNIMRLLPSQVYNLHTREALTRPLLPSGILSFFTAEERTASFIKHYTTSLRNMRYHFPNAKIWLALTGGVDSRTAMAMLEASMIDYATFTNWHPGISEADKDIPPRLANVMGKEYHFFNRGVFLQARQSEYDTHTAGYAADQDRNFWAYQQYDRLKDDCNEVVLLRNSVWECAIDYYGDKKDAFDIERIYPYAKNTPVFWNSLIAWSKMVETDTQNSSIIPTVRCYWDQRMGSWLSSIEQSFDLMDGITSIQITNCRLFLSILMGYKDRHTKKHQMAIIRNIAPSLANIPYEKQYNGYSLKSAPDLKLKIKLGTTFYKQRAIMAVKSVVKKILSIVH